MRRPCFLLIPLVLFINLVAGGASATINNSPSQVVAAFQDGLLSVMKEARVLAVQGRYDRLLPVVEQSFHLPVMIRIATGGYWKKADQEQKRRLVQAFTRMGTGTLATLFDGYSGESFKILGEKPGSQETVLVATQIVRPKKSPVDIIYITKWFQDRWYIVDVLLDKEISELMVRRSEYRAVLGKDGVEGLIAILNGKADELLAE